MMPTLFPTLRINAHCSLLLMLLAIAVYVGSASASSAPSPSPRTVPGLAATLEPDRKVLYKRIDESELYLHIFDPPGFKPTDKRPAFIAIHGGGWTGKTAQRFYPFAHHFSRLGMVGISIDYRLVDPDWETTVFDCVKDGRSAMRYVRAHASELGIDPEKIIVSGGSSGGHIAIGTSSFQTVDDESDDLDVSPEAAAIVLYYPVLDTSAQGYGQDKIGDRWKELSPIEHIRPGMPPTLILQGTADTTTPLKRAREFKRRMIAAGNKCQLIPHRGGIHSYFIFDINLYEQAMKQTEEFLSELGLMAHGVDPLR